MNVIMYICTWSVLNKSKLFLAMKHVLILLRMLDQLALISLYYLKIKPITIRLEEEVLIHHTHPTSRTEAY
ncbi:hypothetical protein RJT34_11655 [Clitoria ternatea]|uniref:Uncharacterized protein n=1 Tax=Clitoria ternatea TaxID=43366 RepID=A0AAN9JNZ9_CLITE